MELMSLNHSSSLTYELLPSITSERITTEPSNLKEEEDSVVSCRLPLLTEAKPLRGLTAVRAYTERKSDLSENTITMLQTRGSAVGNTAKALS